MSRTIRQSFDRLLALWLLLGMPSAAGRSATSHDRRGRESQLRADGDREAVRASPGQRAWSWCSARPARLTRQIQDGAPFEMFLAADEEFPNQLSAAGLTRDAGVVYAVGRLVIFAPEGFSADGR